nr:unnamed protein product [Digitaria exilis]
MAEEQMEEASTAAAAATPFQLQFDKPIPFQIKMAEWNPEKDLLAMVTDDSKVLLHRFNWQRLWTISPGKCITSICWSPDGKIIALGTEEGLVLLHDVENGKMLRTIKSHDVAIVCLNWEEDDPLSRVHYFLSYSIADKDEFLSYEDRTTRFFPPAPVMPRIGGLSSGDTGIVDENEEAIPEFCSASSLFFLTFQNINKIPINVEAFGKKNCQLQGASISKVSLSKNLQKLVVLCYGKLIDPDNLSHNCETAGLHCLYLDTSIFFNRKNELHQVSQQASSIQDLIEVVRASISLISKQWSNAMNLFHEKFSALPDLIAAHGAESSSEDEFLSLLFGTRTSPALHQFLASSLGEAGLKRIAKAVDSAGREIRGVVSEHLQPAVEIISFRLAELRGLARWRSRFQIIGLDEKLIDGVTESIGMLVVQVERFSRVAATVLYLFQNFFTWVLKCVKILLNEPTDQVPAANRDTARHVEQLVVFGGFTDTQFLERSLVKQFNELQDSQVFVFSLSTLEGGFLDAVYHDLFENTLSRIASSLPCYIIRYLVINLYTNIYIILQGSCSLQWFFFDKVEDSQHEDSSYNLTDYVCFKIPDESLNKRNCIGVIKNSSNCCTALSMASLSGFLLHMPDEYECVDLSLYKAVDLQLDTGYGKVRSIPHNVSTPLAVSASRGVACVFSSRRHALVYILDEDEDEDEDEASDME